MSVLPQPIGGDNFEQFYESSQPMVVARINGATYAVADFEIDLNTHGATSSASVTLPITGNPDFSQSFDNVGATTIPCEIFMGWPPSLPVIGRGPGITGLTRAYAGLLSQYDPNLSSGLVTFLFRSLAAPLVDEKLQVVATNVTTVAFIEKLCNEFGLNFQAWLGSAPVTVQQVLGQLYVDATNFSAIINGTRIWDLILKCAAVDNVDVWDQGTVYYA